MKKFTNICPITALAIFLVLVLYYLQTALLEGFEENPCVLRVTALHKPSQQPSSIATTAIGDKVNLACHIEENRDAHAAVIRALCSTGYTLMLPDISVKSWSKGRITS